MTIVPERFTNTITGKAIALRDAINSIFQASGTGHAAGLVPDPGSSAGTTRFLREDATFQAITTSSVLPTPTRAGDIVYWNGSSWVTLAGNNSATKLLQETSTGVPSWVIPTAPTYQSFTSGSGNYTPTSASVLWIVVRMCGGGGGGGAQSTNSGSGGGNSSFGSWTAVGGSGGANNGAGGAGGTGGAAGTGTLIVRLAGSAGTQGQGSGASNNLTTSGGIGGCNAFGGFGGSTVDGAGQNAPANTGGGGGGAGFIGNTNSSSGGGGAGEFVQFLVSSPGTIAYVVGGSGGGGAAGGAAGGNGAAGIIIVEEYYQ